MATATDTPPVTQEVKVCSEEQCRRLWEEHQIVLQELRNGQEKKRQALLQKLEERPALMQELEERPALLQELEVRRALLPELDHRHQEERRALSQELDHRHYEKHPEQDRLVEQRRSLRKAQFKDALKELHNQHQEERWALSKELRELADGRKAIRNQLWANWISDSSPDLGPGRHDLTPEQQLGLSAEDEGPREGDEKIPIRAVIDLIDRQQREKEKQAQLRELLPAKNEVHVEVQHLLEVLDERALWKVFDHRIEVEDPHEIKARDRNVAGLSRSVPGNKQAQSKSVEELANDDIDYVDKQRLGRPEFPECYKEIKKLLDIEKNPIFSATLKEWNRKEELYNRRVESKKNQVASLKNEVYQLIGFFSVFQGVVLTAVSQSSFLYCHNVWSPIVLSVLASVITNLAVIQKLMQMKGLQTNIESEDRQYKTAVKVGMLLRSVQVEEPHEEPLRKPLVEQYRKPLPEPVPQGIDFFELNSEIQRSTNRKLNWRTPSQLTCLYFVFVTLILVVFGVLFPVSFWSILCKPGSPPAQ